MRPLLTTLLVTALGAIIGAIGVYILAEGLPEGAIMGGILGGSVGILIAARRLQGASGPAFEYEAAGIHDDNLITTARRNLVQEAYRDSFAAKTIMDEKIERSASAQSAKRK